MPKPPKSVNSSFSNNYAICIRLLTYVNDNLRKFKSIYDSLATIDAHFHDKNIALSLFNSLCPIYKPFTNAKLKPQMPSYTEFTHLL